MGDPVDLADLVDNRGILVKPVNFVKNVVISHPPPKTPPSCTQNLRPVNPVNNVIRTTRINRVNEVSIVNKVISKPSRKRPVQQRLLQRLKRRQLPLVERGETLGFG